MKKIVYAVMLLLCMSIIGCQKEEPKPDPIKVISISLNPTSLTLTEGEAKEIVATISPSNADNKKIVWATSNSSIATVNEGKVIAIKAGTASITATTDDGGKTANCDVTVKEKQITVSSISLNKSNVELFEGENITLIATIFPENASNKNILWSTNNSSVATVIDGKVSAVKTGTATITVETEDGGKIAECIVTVKEKVIAVESITLDKTEIELTEGDKTLLTATVKPDNATNKNVIWTSDKTDVATVDNNGKVTAVKAGTATITVKTEDGEKTASCVVTVDSDEYDEYVDLGLSVKWATCNLGATKPEEYGLYYQWGDTKGYGSDRSDGKYFDWEDDDGNVTYKWCNGSGNSLIKYNTNSSYGTVDNKMVLDMEDDAARAALGGNWRMPTDAEWTELRETCTWTWTSNYNGTGVAGMIVTSKKSGYTNKSIFLPAAGYRYYDDLGYAGLSGDYWSSSLNTGYPNGAWYVYFGNTGRVGRGNGGGTRYNGFSVRPVSD